MPEQASPPVSASPPASVSRRPRSMPRQTIRWRLASSFPKSLDALLGPSELFAKMVGAMTGGKFTITVHPAGELVPAFGVVDAVQNGTVECCHTAPYYFFGKDDTFALGTAIPFGLNSRQLTAWMFDIRLEERERWPVPWMNKPCLLHVWFDFFDHPLGVFGVFRDVAHLGDGHRTHGHTLFDEPVQAVDDLLGAEAGAGVGVVQHHMALADTGGGHAVHHLESATFEVGLGLDEVDAFPDLFGLVRNGHQPEA